MINLSELLDRAKKKALEKPDEKDGYAPKSTDELRFKRKHVADITPDANGNGDGVFKGDKVNFVNRQSHHGYNPGQDEQVYEETDDSTKTKRFAVIRDAAKKRQSQIGKKPIVTGSRGGVGGAETRRYPAGTLKNSYEPGQDEQIYEETDEVPYPGHRFHKMPLKALKNIVNQNVPTNKNTLETAKKIYAYRTMNEAKTRMPLDGHPYHNKSDAELKYIIKDAGEAAQAMRGQDSKAENKYLDQVNDASTILAYRQKLQKNSYEPDQVESYPIDEMQWNYGKKREPSPNPHPDHEFNKLSDKELKNIIDTHNQTYPERNDYDPTGNRPSRKTPLGSNWSYMSDRDKQKEIKQNPKIQEYLKSAKNFPIAKEILRWRDGQVNESAAPGQEDWIKANKERFIKQYGIKKGLETLYATAWTRTKDK